MQVEQIDRDLLYLTKLADWCGGQGFCQIEGLTDPDEWCFEKWDELRPDSNGDDYSAEALAQSIHARHRHQVRAEVVGEIERLEERMAAAYQLAGSIAFDHDISGPEIERLLDLLSGR